MFVYVCVCVCVVSVPYVQHLFSPEIQMKNAATLPVLTDVYIQVTSKSLREINKQNGCYLVLHSCERNVYTLDESSTQGIDTAV